MKKIFGAVGILLILMLLPVVFLFLFENNTMQNTNKTSFSKIEHKLIYKDDFNAPLRVLKTNNKADSVFLRRKSTDIEFFDKPELEYFFNKLLLTVNAPENQGIGISAPQVGISKNIILVKRFDKPEQNFELFINPIITSYSDTLIRRSDGCLSVIMTGGYSYRFPWIVVKYKTIDGQMYSEKISDPLTAHIFQHEIDHLNGILFTDRMNIYPK